MALTPAFIKNKANVIPLCVLAFGILLIVTTPLLSSDQCPDAYTQAQVDSSSCIIGADIGSGLMIMSGVLMIIAATVALCSSLIAARTHKSTKSK